MTPGAPSTGHAPVDAPRRLAFSPWALFHDDGEHVLVTNAYAPRRPTRLFRERAELRRLLANPAGETVVCPSGLVDELRQLGVVGGNPAFFPAPPHAPGRELRVPMRNCIEVSVRADGAAPPQQAALEPLFRRLGQAEERRPGLVLTVESEEAGEQAAALVGTLRGLAERCGVPAAGIDLRVRTPLSAGTAGLLRLLDDEPGLGIEVEDRSELVEAPEALLEELRAHVGELVETGALVRIALPSVCAAELVERVRDWERHTDFSGVLVRPLVTGTERGAPAPFLDTRAQFDRAHETLCALVETLGSSLQRSEPWASILALSARSGAEREGSGKEVSVAHLDAAGRWSRSSGHAEAFLHAGLAALFPFLQPDAAAPASALLQGEAAPDCQSCAVAAICDGYWRPEVDLLRRTGREARALRLAGLECSLRKALLRNLIEEIHAERAVDRTRGLATASFDDKKLSLHWK